MNTIPFAMRALRWYSLRSPVHRGTSRVALWYYQHGPVPPVETEVALGPDLYVSLRLPIWVDYNIYCLGLYERYLAHLFMAALHPGAIVLDVGAYIGQYALLASRRAPRGQIVALEPHPESFSRLRGHVVRNGLRNVTPIPKAAGERPVLSSLALHPLVFSSRLLPEGPQRVSNAGPTAAVQVTTVDAIVRDLSLPRVDAIKIDVEGAEAQVFRGAHETLERYHPLLLFEIDRADELVFGDTPEALASYLCGLGYVLHRPHRQRLLPLAGSLPDHGNLFAVARAAAAGPE